jgi:hypothetical protein
VLEPYGEEGRMIRDTMVILSRSCVPGRHFMRLLAYYFGGRDEIKIIGSK